MKRIIRFREKLILVGVFFVSFVFNLKYISLHSFLHDWDERFHALVAKHLADNFLLPLLYKDSPIPVCDYSSWVCNTVWLHKQPLFLWQMALSIKLFGATEWAVRFPSALMLSLLVFPVYRVGTLMFNKQTGSIAALLTVSNWFIIEHIDGILGMDHNDVAFMFYVTLSVWALMEYINTPKLKFIVLMGLFSGCAMLNKWVTGLLVFEGLFVFFLLYQLDAFLRNGLRLTFSVAIAFLIFMPWQVYCFTHFHDNAMFEWSYNQRHFWETVEGHSHERFFYIHQLGNQFSLLQLFVFAGVFLSLFRTDKLRYGLPTIVMVLSVYVFFTLAATKVDSYVMVAMPFMFVFMAYAFTCLLDFIQKLNAKAGLAAYFLIIPFLMFQNFNHKKIETDHYLSVDGWFQHANYNKAQNTVAYKAIAKMGLGQKTIIVGLENNAAIEGMFYTGLPCYGFGVSAEAIESVCSQGYKIVVFQNNIPASLKGRSALVVVPYNYL